MNGMNETLARLYGTGLDKTASAEDELDLSQISAADFLAAVENGDIVMNNGEELEKEAGDEELDLETMSPSELVELAQYLDSLEEEDQGGEVLEKMAQSGELEYWDMAGRVLAHSLADEMSKTASYDDDEDEIFGLDELSAEDLMEGLESGELELVELDDDGDFEKEAAYFTTGQAKVKGLIGKGGPSKMSALLSKLREAATGHGAAEMRTAARMKNVTSTGSARGGAARRKKYQKIRGQERLKGYGKRGLGVAGVGAAGAGAHALNKRRKKNK